MHRSTREFEEACSGRLITDIRRRGKQPVLTLDAARSLVVRLGMSGRLLICSPQDPMPPHAHIVLALSSGQELRYVDPRTFGHLSVWSGTNLDQIPGFEKLGPEPLSDGFDGDQLYRRLSNRSSMLAVALMNQRIVAGIGKIYSDEICFLARLDPRMRAHTVSSRQAGKLHTAMRCVLESAIEHGGTTAADGNYVDLYGQPGCYQKFLAVYQRTGQPCLRCSTPIARVALSDGRGLHFCLKCQMVRRGL
jgi:formamidopyrimidine-DNA glycosylase